MNEVIIARPMEKRKKPEEVTCSVIIPCRNERGNIEQAVLRTPDLGNQTELIFVEGNSSDGTLEECKRVKSAYPQVEVIIMTGHGSESDEEEARRLGAYAYLQKPVDINDLMETIRNAGEARRKAD